MSHLNHLTRYAVFQLCPHRVRRLPRSLLLLVLTAGCGHPPAPLSAEHAAAIADSARGFLSEFTRLSEAAEWDSLTQLYSTRDNFRFLENGRVQYTSAAAVRDALHSLSPGTRIRTDFSDVAVQPIAPGATGVTARFTSLFVDSAGGAFSFSGALSLLLEHESGGWRIITGHASAPVPRER